MDEIKNTLFNDELSERVDRFLLHKMADEESRAFAEEIKTNPELKEYYLRQFNLMRGIKVHEMRELMRQKEQELSIERVSPAPVPFFSKYRYVLSTVAVAAAMVCGVFVWDGSRTRSIGTVELASVVWKGSDPIEDCIEAGNYKEAIDLIDEELGKPYEIGDDPSVKADYTRAMNDLKYRKALVYLKMGKKRDAKVILKELNDDRSKQILDKLLW